MQEQEQPFTSPLELFLMTTVPEEVGRTGLKFVRQRRELNPEPHILDERPRLWKFWKIGVRDYSISFSSCFLKKSIIETFFYLAFGEKSAQQWEQYVPRPWGSRREDVELKLLLSFLTI